MREPSANYLFRKVRRAAQASSGQARHARQLLPNTRGNQGSVRSIQGEAPRRQNAERCGCSGERGTLIGEQERVNEVSTNKSDRFADSTSCSAASGEQRPINVPRSAAARSHCWHCGSTGLLVTVLTDRWTIKQVCHCRRSVFIDTASVPDGR